MKTGAMKVKAKNKNRVKNSNWQFWAIIAVPLIYAIVFAYIPMGGVILAFKDYSIRKGIWGSDWVGLRYFKQFLLSPSSSKVIINTLVLGFYSLLASFPIPILLAVGLNEVKAVKFKKTVQMITYAPYFISTVVMVGMLMQMTDLRIGIINKLLGLFGVGPVNFFGDVDIFRSLYVWSGVWQGMGYSAVIYIAALASVDTSQVEAAIIDGAGRFARVWNVDIPAIMPTIVIQLILAVGSIMSLGFEKVYLMQNPVNMQFSEIISTFVYKRGLINFQYSYATAVGLFNSVCNLVLIVLANMFSKKVNETSLW